MSGFDEVIEGVWHWQAEHPRIKQPVHSAYLSGSRTAIDPIGCEGLVEELGERGGVDLVLLSNRHHLRGAEPLVEAFGCGVRAPASGMHEFEPGQGVEPYEWGEELAPGVTAHEIGAICPDDGAFHVEVGPGALALADAVIVWDGELVFVPDFLMDEPERVKPATVAALESLLELEFDALLLAHGDPIPAGGKDALRRFVANPGSADFEL